MNWFVLEAVCTVRLEGGILETAEQGTGQKTSTKDSPVF